jgi:hypothetical protein
MGAGVKGRRCLPPAKLICVQLRGAGSVARDFRVSKQPGSQPVKQPASRTDHRLKWKDQIRHARSEFDGRP